MLAGLEAAQAHPELRPIKVNAVALRGFTEDEVLRFAAFAREQPYEVRFIEFMPLDADQALGHGQGAAERRGARRSSRPSTSSCRSAASATAPRGATRSPTARGEIGFISPVTEPFCGDCNRIRLTAEGMLRTCLFSLHETDLRAPLRGGASDDELEEIVRDAVWRKELKHHVGEPGFRQPPRSMSRIGG